MSGIRFDFSHLDLPIRVVGEYLVLVMKRNDVRQDNPIVTKMSTSMKIMT